MKNRVTVTVAGQEYTLLGSEEESYIRQVAAYVDGHMRTTMTNTKLSLMDAAVLSALDIADECFKARADAEKLRGQLKELLEESAKSKLELAEAKRELFRAQQKK